VNITRELRGALIVCICLLCTSLARAQAPAELLEIAVQHAVAIHGHVDTPEFRRELKEAFKEGAAPP